MSEPTIADICAAWTSVFDRHVDDDDDFFLLGGDSLAAVEISVILEEGFGVDIDLVDFFTCSTPRQLLETLLSPNGGSA
ncbi:hypothetical protein BH10ACT8_BH10ACT8_08490 [soil metagenome]